MHQPPCTWDCIHLRLAYKRSQEPAGITFTMSPTRISFHFRGKIRFPKMTSTILSLTWNKGSKRWPGHLGGPEKISNKWQQTSLSFLRRFESSKASFAREREITSTRGMTLVNGLTGLHRHRVMWSGGKIYLHEANIK